jgi:hypothetical protein
VYNNRIQKYSSQNPIHLKIFETEEDLIIYQIPQLVK